MTAVSVKVGIAIATFNRAHRLRTCLESICSSTYQNTQIVVFDDGDDDKTKELISSYYPDVILLEDEKELWWAESTNRAMKYCLDSDCDAVMLLNDDCVVERDTIAKLVDHYYNFGEKVFAPIVRNINQPNQIWWSGARCGLRSKNVPVWGIYQLHTHNTDQALLPRLPFDTAEFTGRGTFIPRKVIESVGYLDSKTFPQYGSDNDYSLRVNKSPFQAMVVPDISVLLHVEDGGQLMNGAIVNPLIRCYRMLFKKKYGAYARVWFFLLWKHAPRHHFITSYTAIMVGVILRAFRKHPT